MTDLIAAELTKHIATRVREEVAAQTKPAADGPPAESDEDDVSDLLAEFVHTFYLAGDEANPEEAKQKKRKWYEKFAKTAGKVAKALVKPVVQAVVEVLKESGKNQPKLPPGPLGPRPGSRN